MPAVELVVGGVGISGVVEQEFLVLPITAVLSAGGVIRPAPGRALPDPAAPDSPPHWPLPPQPPAPPPRRRVQPPPPAVPVAERKRPKRGGKRWNRPAKKEKARRGGR